MAELTTTETATAAAALTAIAGPGNFQEKLAYVATNDVFILPLGGLETTLATTQKAGFRAPFPFIVTDVRASVDGVASGSAPTFDVNKNGTSFLATKLTIDVAEATSTTAATPYAFETDDALRTFADDDSLSVDVDVAGTSAEGGRVLVYYTRLG